MLEDSVSGSKDSILTLYLLDAEQRRVGDGADLSCAGTSATTESLSSLDLVLDVISRGGGEIDDEDRFHDPLLLDVDGNCSIYDYAWDRNAAIHAQELVRVIVHEIENSDRCIGWHCHLERGTDTSGCLDWWWRRWLGWRCVYALRIVFAVLEVPVKNVFGIAEGVLNLAGKLKSWSTRLADLPNDVQGISDLRVE
jgi:hypothetical protein